MKSLRASELSRRSFMVSGTMAFVLTSNCSSYYFAVPKFPRSAFVFERQLHPGAICRHFAVLDFQIGLYNFGNAQIAQCSSSRLDCISCGILPGFRTRADYLRYFIYGVCSLCLFWHV